jgi:hypothetical protein
MRHRIGACVPITRLAHTALRPELSDPRKVSRGQVHAPQAPCCSLCAHKSPALVSLQTRQGCHFAADGALPNAGADTWAFASPHGRRPGRLSRASVRPEACTMCGEERAPSGRSLPTSRSGRVHPLLVRECAAAASQPADTQATHRPRSCNSNSSSSCSSSK